MRQITVIGNRVLPEAEAALVRAQVSASMRQRAEREAQIRALARQPRAEDAASMRFAMRAVEQRIVKGLWVLEVSQTADGPKPQRKHGIEYLPEGIDHYGTVVSGGKWEPAPSRPPAPSSKAIDAAKEVQGWMEWLDEGQARLLTLAAMTKRGDRANKVNWAWVKVKLRVPEDFSLRTLQDRYDRALRTIVAELTLMSISR